MITTIAAPPLVKVGRVKTIRELDNDLANGPGSIIDVRLYQRFLITSNKSKQNTNVMGVDLSILSNSALCLPEHVMEEDRPWDWDILFTQISSELASEDKSYEVFSPLDDLAAARKTGILPLGKVPKAAAGERRPTVKDLAGGKVKGPIQRPTEV
ncbi:intraflagellar transport protein 43-domain-containing protein [Cladochytrium replicatum]|nr:intraflagellar transport protein 43-domain-containing protein [Cladochytrium replicatum]